MELVHKPQQVRSKDTQEKILVALECLLEERFFEQISIRNIAKKADVSSGTIYRRFKNKEALLPVLYKRFDSKFNLWAVSIWNEKKLSSCSELDSRIEHVIKEHVTFYKKYAHILRTLYLYIRLNGELSLPNLEQKRESIYGVMLAPIWESLEPKIRSRMNAEKVRCLILVLLSTINERILFENYKPSTILMLDEDIVVRELTLMFKSYLVAWQATK